MKEINEKEVSKVAGGKSIRIESINGYYFCPNPSCNRAWLEEVKEKSGKWKGTNERKGNCGKVYYLYECPTCKTRYRKYYKNDFPHWTTD